MTPQERAKQLAADHWGYVKPTIEAHAMLGRPDVSLELPMYSWNEMIEIAAYHYRTAAVHFYGHGVEDERNGMFTTLPVETPTVKDATAGSLCHTCQRNAPLMCHGEYLKTKDGGCEGYCLPPITVPPPAPLRERILDAKQEAPKPSLCHSCHAKVCTKEIITACEETGTCIIYVPAPEAKQEAPTAAEQPVPHSDPSTNCKDCGNAACNGIGRNLTCDQGCERFTPKTATWTRYDIWQKIEMENARSKEIHGSWHQYTPQEQREAIRNEYFETKEAFKLGDVDGTHGEVAELIQLANLCFRRIQFLKGEADA